MMLVEGINVLTRDYVNLSIPVPIEGVKLGKLASLLLSEMREVLCDKVQAANYSFVSGR